MDIVTEVYAGSIQIRNKSYKIDGIDTDVKFMFPINPLMRSRYEGAISPTSGHLQTNGCAVTLAIIKQD